MNNEPVAWMLVDEINGDYMLERHPSGDYDWIPLYTHPVKDPTDEIVALLEGIDKEQDTENGWWETSVGAKFGSDILEKIKAILRKAQEK